ncbi:KTSC domain-containing protein [Aphanothece hegewaldii]|nr:KTSC domain-containing protein [Aphanothece hegewaldii]
MFLTENLPCSGSSVIQKIGYCDRRAILEIHFHHGGRYQYENVPRFVFDGMVSTNSLGQYYNRCIKGFFGGKKL